jgi:hypothetical protein
VRVKNRSEHAADHDKPLMNWPAQPHLSPDTVVATRSAVAPTGAGTPGVDLDRAGIVAEGIRGEFTSLLRGLPGGLRNVSELSRHLDVARPVCQRLVGGIRRSGSVELLLAMPGVQGLEQVIAAARARGADQAAVERAQLAVARYDELVQINGGSQSKLNAAIRSAQLASKRGARVFSSASAGEGEISVGEHRRHLFEAGRALLDRSCDCKFSVIMLAPNEDNPKRVDHVGAYGYIGVRSGPRASPICMSQRLAIGQTPEEVLRTPAIRSLRSNAPMQGFGQALLEPFCSQPLTQVVSRTRGPNLDQFIEFAHHPDARAADVVLADRSIGGVHPRDDEPPLVNMATLADVPPRSLIVAIYLHRSIARECVASSGCYVLGVRGTVATQLRLDGVPECVPPSERWFDRLMTRPTVEYLSPGLDSAETPFYPRMQELCGALFHAGGERGWDPAEFVGFRVSVEYPVWNAEYLLSLDFFGEERPEAVSGPSR